MVNQINIRVFWSLIIILLVIPFFASSNTNHETHEILIENNRFRPNRIEIQPEDTVIFKWVASASGHNVAQTETDSSTDHNEGFRSGDPQNDPMNWTLPSQYTQDDAVLYFICEPHVISDSMRGTIIVGDATENVTDNNQLLWIIIITVTLFIFAGFIIIIHRSPN